jgi:hypothetical protein
MPACIATGQAAGSAASLAAQGNGKMREVDIRELQQDLIRQGAFIDLKGYWADTASAGRSE